MLGSLPLGSKLASGRYRLKEIIGSGAFGHTYLAEDSKLKRKVAVKEFFPADVVERRGSRMKHFGRWTRSNLDDWRHRFLKEAQMLANLDHPGVVKVHDHFDENDTSYFVMTYISGDTLHRWIRRGLQPDKAISWMDRLVKAVNYLHRNDVLHLDIKPSNIMIQDRRQPVLIDFGSAKARIAKTLRVSEKTIFAWTPSYAAPELKESRSELIGPRSDLFSLAATYHEILIGEPPQPTLSEDLDDETRSWLQSALASDPEARPADVRTWWKLRPL